MRSRSRGLLAVLAAIATLSGVSATACYSHDGIEALQSLYYTGTEMVSCGNGTNTCCKWGEKCGSDLLCHRQDGTTYRQYCADKDWKGCSALCPQYDAAGIGLTPCEDNVYCCGDSDECCALKEGIPVDPSNGNILPNGTVPTGVVVYWNQPSLPSTATSSATSRSSASSTTSSISETSASNTNAGASSTATLPSPSQTGSAGSKHSGLSAGAGAGIGVGCVIAVGLLGTLLWLLFRERKKRRNLEQKTSAGNWPAPPQYPQANPAHPNEAMPMFTNQPEYMAPAVYQSPQEMEGLKSQLHEMESQPRGQSYEMQAKLHLQRMQ